MFESPKFNTPKKSLCNRFHLAGIVPVAMTLKSDYGMKWPDVLSPLSQNYTIIENAIYTAACAGCETIWVVMEVKTIALFKEVLGDWIRDPTVADALTENQLDSREKRIPIIYVPVRPQDFKRRESIPWSIFTGVYAAYKTTLNLSRWTTPDAYFVSFPYGIVDHRKIRENRLKISSKNRFYCSYEGKTVKDGEYLPFTFLFKDFVAYRNRFKEKANNKYVLEEEFDITNPRAGGMRKLPPKERYTGRYFEIKDVFDIAEIGEEDLVLDLEWFHDVGMWDGYRGFMADERTDFIKRPSQRVMPPLRWRRWLPMGVDEIIEEKQQLEDKKEENDEQDTLY